MPTPMLLYIQTQMNLYGYPILLIFGDIGNIFVLILFYRERHNPCSIYLIGSAIANILYLTIGGLLKIVYNSYSNGGLEAVILCKLSNYIPGFLGQVTKTCLIFACIDRCMITSRSARLRAYSTPKRAKYITCGTYIIWSIIPIHILIGTTVDYGQCTMASWYIIFSAFYVLLSVSVIPSIVLCIFGYLTLRNMKLLHNRVQPTKQAVSNNNNNISLKRRDRELLIIVLTETVIYIITTGPFTIVSLESMITKFLLPVKNLSLLQAEVFALNAAFLLILLFSAMPFYTYMVASTSFRRDFKQLILTKYQKIRRLLPNHTASIAPRVPSM